MATIIVDFATFDANQPYNAGDIVIVQDTAANLQALTAAQIAELGAGNADFVDSLSDVLILDATQAAAFGDISTAFDPSDFVQISDTGANIAALTSTEIAALASHGLAAINPSDNVLTFDVAQFQALGQISVNASATFTIGDTGANIAALTVGQIGALSLQGVDVIDATDNALSLSVAQYQALGTVALTSGDTVTLSDTGANIAALTAGQIAALVNIDAIDATDNVLSLSVAQYNALGGITLTAGDTVTLADTGANLAALTAGQIGALAGNNIDKIDATDNALSLTVAQYNALGTVALTAGDTVTLADTGANLAALTATDIGNLVNIDAIHATDNVLSLDLSQLDALATAGIALTAGDTVTLSDTEANIEALTGAQLAGYGTQGVDLIHASDSSTLNMSESQVAAVLGSNAAFATGDTVTLVDTGANIALLTAAQFGQLATKGVDAIDASDDTLTISAAQFSGLGSTTLTAGDNVTISDTAAHLLGLTFSGLAGANVDFLDATDAISVTVQNVTDLGSVVFTSGSAVTLADTGAHIAALTAGQIGALAGSGIDTINATDDALSLTVAQYNALGTVTLTAGDTVTLADTGANLAALTAVDIGNLVNIDAINATDDALTLDLSQLDALATAGIALTAGDTVTLSDTEANIEALTGTALAGYATQGVDLIHASDSSTLNMSESQVAAVLGSNAAFATGDTVTLVDTGANIALLTAGQFGQLYSKGVDAIDASDNTLNLTVAQYQGLGNTSLTAGDTVTLSDTGAHLASLSATDISNLVNIDAFDATDNAISLSAAQLDALATASIPVDASDTLTLADTEANIEALTQAQVNSYINTQGVDSIHATDTSTLNIAGGVISTVIASSASFAAGDTVTLVDLGTNIQGFTAGQLGQFSAHGIDAINASNDALALSVAQYTAIAGNVALTAGDTVTLSDTGANIASLTSGQFAALAGNNIDIIDATDNTLSLTAAQFTGLGTVALAGGDNITLADTGANISALSSTVWGTFATKGIDVIDASDNVLSMSVAQYSALGTTTLTNADTVTLLDTGANLGTLTATQIGQLAGKGVDIIDASDNVLALTVAKFNALGTVNLRASDTVTLADTGANIAALTVAQFNAMHSKGVDGIDATDDAITLAVAQAQGIAGLLTIASGDVVTVSDTEAHIEALSGSQLAGLANANVDIIHAADTSTLHLTETQVQPFLATAGTFATGDTVTLIDTGANIAALTSGEFGELASHGIDAIDASDNTLTLTAAQFSGLGTTTLTLGDAVTLADTGANLAALDFSTLAAKNVDTLDATDDVLNITVAQYNDFGGTHLTLGDVVTLTDTEAHLEALTPTDIGNLVNVDAVDSLNNTLNLTVAQYNAFTGNSIGLTAGDTVTLADTGANLAALTATDIGNLVNIDAFNATDDAVTFDAGQLGAIVTAGIGLSADDLVTLSDSEANIEALTGADFTNFVNLGVDIIHAGNSTLNVTASQVTPLLSSGTAFASGDTVTLLDSSANITALNSTNFGDLAAAGIDVIDATDNTWTITAAQFAALGTVTLTAADNITLTDTGTHIQNLTATQIGDLATKHVDTIDASNDALTLSVAQFNALGSVTLTAGDTVTLRDTGANLATLDFSTLAGKNVDKLDASDNQLAITVQQYNDFGGTHLTAGDNVTLADTGANLAALTATDIGNLVNVDAIDATDNAISLDISQLDALTNASISLAAGDTITLSDTEANIEALSGAELSGYVAQGADIISASDTSTLTLTVSQVQPVLSTTGVFASGNTVTLADTGANVEALGATALGELATHNVDRIDTTDNTLTLTAAQAGALGSVSVASGDTFTLSDTGANIAALTATQIATLASINLDTIDATDNAVSLTAGQAAALGTIVFDGTDTVTLADTGAHIAALTAGQIGALAGSGIDTINATDDALALTVAQYNALGTVALTAGDTVTLADTGANLAALTSTDIGNLVNIDAINATDDALSLDLSQLDALATAGIALTAGDTVTLSDTEANIEALTGGNLSGYATQGVDLIHASDSSTLNMSESQVAAVLGSNAAFATGDTVTLVDTGANIALLTAAQFGQLATKGVDAIDASDDTLTISAAQFSGLGSTTLTAGDNVTISDTAAHLLGLTFSGLAGANVDFLDATDAISVTVQNVTDLGSVVFTSGSAVTLADTGAHIAALTAGQIGALAGSGIDTINATDDALSLTVAQYNALGTVTLTAGDTVTLADTGANLAALTATDIGNLVNIDAINATNDALSLDLSQLDALATAGIALTAGDTVTLSDTEANIEALTGAQLAGYGTQGVDFINASDTSTLNMNEGQVAAVLGSTATFGDGDNVTLSDTGANIALLSATQLGQLAGDNVDQIDATDNALSFSLAQYSAIGVTIATNDALTVTGTSAADTISGHAGIDTLNGLGRADTLNGLGGNDTLVGGSGNDTLNGGTGADDLTGGKGADTFVFSSISDSANNHQDVIEDFSHAQGDLIDLSAIDAKTGGADNAFHIVSAFTGAKGQLVITAHGTNEFLVRGDVNGDGRADFTIDVHSHTALTATDFIL